MSELFDPMAGAPAVEDFGLHTFALLLPAGWDEEDPEPFPLYLDIAAGLAGWVEEPYGLGANSWSLDVSGAEPEYVKGKYHDAQLRQGAGVYS